MDFAQLKVHDAGWGVQGLQFKLLPICFGISLVTLVSCDFVARCLMENNSRCVDGRAAGK